MSDPRRYVVIFLVTLAASLALADEGSVPLYTNADLERFRVAETMDDVDGPVGMATPEDGSWQFVNDFLAREHKRLDAERENDLARRRLQLAERPARRRYSLPFYPYFWWRGGTPGHPRRPGIGHRPVHMPVLDGRDAVPGPPDLRPSHGYDLPPARAAGPGGKRIGSGGRGRGRGR